MDVSEALRRRRMTRAFDGSELDEDLLAALCEEAMRAPTAGNARGVEAVVLAGTAGTRAYLDAATDEEWRATSRRAAGLARAGGAVVVLVRPDVYAARYAAPDKASSGLGDRSAWPVPYWFGDAGSFTMSLLLLVEEAGLAGCFLGAFRHARRVLDAVGAPGGAELFGAVLVGVASPDDVASASASREGLSRAARVSRGRYGR